MSPASVTMKFENSNGHGHMKDWSDVNHNAEQRKVSSMLVQVSLLLDDPALVFWNVTMVVVECHW